MPERLEKLIIKVVEVAKAAKAVNSKETVKRHT
jgi:hypothetical protein